jgi:fatty acid desaturase
MERRTIDHDRPWLGSWLQLHGRACSSYSDRSHPGTGPFGKSLWVGEMSNRQRRDLYGLNSSATDFARAAGLADGDWFRSDIPRKRMKELMKRTDMPAIRDTILWIGLAIGFATAGVLLWGTWWAVPCFIAYGVLYGSASDSRWHETGHGTAFKTRWMNEAVYQLASFCMMRNPTPWRFQHTLHHTDTLIVGIDPEILAMRPARLARIIANLVGLLDVPWAIYQMLLHSSGRLTADEKTWVPAEERYKAYRTARIWLAIYATAIGAAVVTQSWLPVVLIGGPRMYGAFMHILYALTQHAGMGENVLDHRLNTRTVLMGRVNSFLYWNMNYHLEHHMFPTVPYHRLPDLHEAIKKDVPAPYPSMWAALKEIIPAVLHQLRDQTYFIKRELPPTAAPYHGPVDGLMPEAANPR